MIKFKYIFTILFVSTTIGFSFGQNVDFKSSNFKDDKEGYKKASEAFKKGDEFLALGNEALFNVSDYKLNYKKALQSYEVAQKFNPNNAELNFKIGVSYANSTDPFLSIPYFKKAKELDPKCDPFLNYYYGYAMQLEGSFDAALMSYVAFENEYKKADNFSKFVLQRKKECAAAKKFIKSPVRAWVDNINEINTEFDDIAPSISVDGAEMIMSSNRPNSNTANEVGGFDHDIYSTTIRDFKWNAPQRLRGAINSDVDDVTNTISYDGTKMLLHRTGADNQSDIYESHLKGLDWTEPIIMSNQISSAKANEKYGCYNDDGWKIYFTRDNENKSNGMEVMFSAMQSKIRKDYMGASMVSAVNSKFNEGPIYISVDGETMYVASEGSESMGGYDIFMSKKVQGQWSIPVNMGYPINSPYDDFYFSPTANGKFAYISSNRAGGKGGFDIYKVTFWGDDKAPIVEVEEYLLASIASPMKDNQIEAKVDVNKKSLTVFKGITIDAMTKKPVESVIDITDNVTGKIIESFTTNSATGKFLLTLPSGKNYGIAVKAEGYLFHSENFDIPNGSDDALINKVIELKNIAIGSKIALRNIFFDVAKATLRPESNTELDRLVKLMQDVPKLKIEISGHTDNTGSATLNETLSQARAEAVVSYLKTKGISADRMNAKGYGMSRPVAPNTTESGRQLNRRTEFEIVGN